MRASLFLASVLGLILAAQLHVVVADDEAGGIVDADDGSLGEDDVGAEEDAEADVDASGEASQRQPPQQQQQEQRGIPREVFEQLIQRSSPTCKEQLQALVASQGKSSISEDCNAEAAGIMQQLRAEMEAQQQQQQQQQQQPGQGGTNKQDGASQGWSDGTTDALIVIVFFGVILAGIAGAIYANAPPAAQPLSPEEAEKRRKAEEKREAKRRRKGKPPKQPTVEVY